MSLIHPRYLEQCPLCIERAVVLTLIPFNTAGKAFTRQRAVRRTLDGGFESLGFGFGCPPSSCVHRARGSTPLGSRILVGKVNSWTGWALQPLSALTWRAAVRSLMRFCGYGSEYVTWAVRRLALFQRLFLSTTAVCAAVSAAEHLRRHQNRAAALQALHGKLPFKGSLDGSRLL